MSEDDRPNWARTKGLSQIATFHGHTLEMKAMPGAGTGYGGWYGYVDGRFVGGADNEVTLEIILIEYVSAA